MPANVAVEKVVVKKGDTVWGIAKKYKVKDYKKLWKHKVNKKLHDKCKGNERKLDVKDVVFVPSDLSPLVKPEPVTVQIGKKTYEFDDEKARDKFLATVKIVDVKGKKMVFIGKEYDEFVKKMLGEIRRGPLLEAQTRAEGAEYLWKHFKEQNDDQYIVAWFVSLTGPDLPSGALIDRAILAYKTFETAVKSGDFKKIEAAMKTSAKPINEAYDAMMRYRKEVIGSAEGWLKGLEYTKTGSFAIVGALATPMAVSAVGSAALGNAIVGGGTALLSSAANEAGHGLAGTSEGIAKAAKNVALDTFIGSGVTGLLKSDKGQQIVKGVTDKVIGQLGGKYMTKASNAVIKKYAVQYLTEASDKLMERAVQEAGKRANPKTKADAFIDLVAKNKSISDWAKTLDKAIDAEFASAVYDAMPNQLQKLAFDGKKSAEAIKVIDDLLSSTAVASGKALEGALSSARPSDDVMKVVRDAGERIAKDKKFIRELEAAAVLE